MQPKKRNILQDIQPITKHSVRVPRVDMPNRGGVMRSTHRIGSLPRPVSAQHRSRSKMLFVVSILLFIFAFVFGSYFFAKATVTLTPKQETIDITEPVTLVRTNTTDATKAGIPFEVMSLSRKEAGEVIGDTTREVSRKATGTVTFFNKRSVVETLVKGTRVSDGTDKVFTLTETIKIPKAIKSGDQIIPGQIAASVVAAEDGARFNIRPSDFTIVAYKGGSKETQVYGRSVADFTGGVVGTVFVAQETEYNKIFDALTASIKEKLWIQAQAEAPKQYAIFSGGTVFEDLSSHTESVFENDTAKVPVRAEGALRVVLVERQALLAFLTQVVAKKYTIAESDVQSISIEPLEVGFKEDSLDERPNLTGDTIPVILRGKIMFTWRILPETVTTLRTGLVSTYTRNFAETIKKFERIGKAHVSIQPFWWPIFPRSAGEIQITVVGQSD